MISKNKLNSCACNEMIIVLPKDTWLLMGLDPAPESVSEVEPLPPLLLQPRLDPHCPLCATMYVEMYNDCS